MLPVNIGIDKILCDSLTAYIVFLHLHQTRSLQSPSIPASGSSDFGFGGPACVFLFLKDDLKANRIGQYRDDQIVLDLEIWGLCRAILSH